jgi:hypothetical protein
MPFALAIISPKGMEPARKAMMGGIQSGMVTERERERWGVAASQS